MADSAGGQTPPSHTRQRSIRRATLISSLLLLMILGSWLISSLIAG